MHTRKKNRRFATIAALSLVAVAIAGCGSDAEPDAAPETTATPTTAAAAPDTTPTEEPPATETPSATETPTATESSAVTEAPPAGEAIRVVYIPKNLGNPYFDSIVAGLEEAAPDLNMTIEVVGPAQAGAEDQIQYIDSAVQQEVDAILISPNDPDAVVPSLKRAMDAGIRVISVNSDMNVEGRELAILPVDFTQLGDFLVDLTAQVTGGEGTFAILSATSTAPDQNAWIEGVKASLDAGTAPGLELVDVVYGDDEPDKSANETRALLTKYPDLTAINAPTTVGVAAAAQVLSTSPQKGKVQVTGLGTPNQMRQYVKDGTVQKFALWDPKAEGILAAHLVAQLIAGTVSAEAGATFEVPGVGEREITADTQIITGPPFVFDASNIDDFDF